MSLRDRKHRLIGLLKIKAVPAKLTPEQVAAFELMYRHARNEADQDQVTAALDAAIEGWKTNRDAFARVRQDYLDDSDEDDDEDSPALQRSRVTFLKSPRT